MQNTKAPAAAEEPEGHNMRTKWIQKPNDSRRAYVRAKIVLFQLQQAAKTLIPFEARIDTMLAG
jgi:hypothetical protein